MITASYASATTQKQPLSRLGRGAGMLTMLLMTTACTTSTDQQSVMDAVDHRDVVVDLVIDTTEHLDVDGWGANHGAAKPESCTLDNGDEGAAYKFSLWADRGTAHEADAQRIVEYWESLGMDTRVVDHGGFPVVYATGGPVQRASFTPDAAEESYRVGAISHCAPGDAIELRRAFDERRKQGERFPGDEYVPEENIDDVYKNE
ncbi:hypothetical protein [Enteractinococcus coprophilus]|uniref:Uncharacterized protein n=1 Tax=Enteractinococcus coprophilus TaxID=1027633 RepID=A0A543ANQ6_9MICC|nr:hypothetical protein [Enteractinococcus coprophilus]TQL74185.1 hypothetical protein FB556_0638 [Enteractinococcus coprophilus]